MPMSSTTSMMSAPWPRPAVISLTTTSHSTTGPLPSASRTHCSAASAIAGSSPSRSMSTDESIAIIDSRIHRVARRAPAQLAHDVVGAHAVGQLEAATGPRHGVVDVLAQDDAAVLEFDLQGRALGQAQRVAHRLGQGDLAAFGNCGFHGRLPGRSVCAHYTYFAVRTSAAILDKHGAAPRFRHRC